MVQSKGRDWSAWIDTIETQVSMNNTEITGLRRDWSAWIDTIETDEEDAEGDNAGSVGIDLHELIRLKHSNVNTIPITNLFSRDWSAWIDTIETLETIFNIQLDYSNVGIDLHELIRLKLP